MEGTLGQPPEGRETRGADARTEPQEWAPEPWIAEPSTAHDAEGRKVGRHKPEDRPTTTSWRPCPLTADPRPERSTLGDEHSSKSRRDQWSLA